MINCQFCNSEVKKERFTLESDKQDFLSHETIRVNNTFLLRCKNLDCLHVYMPKEEAKRVLTLVDAQAESRHRDPNFKPGDRCRTSLWNPCIICCQQFYKELSENIDLSKLKNLKASPLHKKNPKKVGIR